MSASGLARRIGRGTIWYSIGVFASRAISIIMLPVYTRYLTTTDYGVLQLLSMTTDIASILLTAGMASGMQRFYFKAETEEEKHTVVASTFVLQVGLAVAGSALIFMLAGTIWERILGFEGQIVMIQIVALDFTLAILSSVPLLYVQTLHRAEFFVRVTLLKLVLQLSLNILFVVGFKWGATGIITSTAIANGIVGVCLVIWLFRQIAFRVNRSTINDLRRFGVPNQITFGGAFIMTFGDRFFLQASSGVSTVGLYGMAYQFGFILHQVTATPFLQAWNPVRHELLKQSEADRSSHYKQGFFYFSLILVSGATGLALFIQPIFRVLTTPSFYDAAYLVPAILAAYVCQAWMDAIRFGIDVSEKTKYYTYATWISVALIIGLYAMLIPRFGGHGAGIATLIAFMLRMLLVGHFSNRLWYIDYGWQRVMSLVIPSLLSIAVYYAVRPSSVWAQLLLASSLFIAYAVVIWRTSLGPDGRQLLARAFLSPKEAILLLSGRN